jgi:O-antigen/teichoic acid export membrane protein
VGLYFAATRLASLLGLIEFAVGATYGHRFARATPGALPGLYAEARRMTALPGLALGVALAASAPLILRLFGAEFTEAALPLAILVAAGTLRLSIGPAEDLLANAGRPVAVWRANAAGATAMAAGALLLCGPYGATGAALASALGTLVATAMLARALRAASREAGA